MKIPNNTTTIQADVVQNTSDVRKTLDINKLDFSLVRFARITPMTKTVDPLGFLGNDQLLLYI